MEVKKKRGRSTQQDETTKLLVSPTPSVCATGQPPFVFVSFGIAFAAVFISGDLTSALAFTSAELA